MSYKQPMSALIVIHTPALQVLLIERSDYQDAWQSVTGSREGDESLLSTARRELLEETGFDSQRYCLRDWRQQNRYEIYPRWLHRYPPGTEYNTEHVFSLELPQKLAPQLNPREHTDFIWLPWQEAAAKVFSPSNADAIRQLPLRQADWK